ncbi:hypothetical protein F1C58_14890 [Glaciihabitans sp. INWT7]|nr:hypothetical protein F1C58_14890 [Glaciihabitans sp. INWT7]
MASAVALVITAMVGLAPALADTAPASANDPQTVSADSLPTAQINGVVWDQEIVGNTVYVGGNFSKARPAGSAPGTNEVPRTDLMAYNLQTGVMTSFAPVLNGEVRALDSSPDGTRLYAVGTFTTVNGVAKNRIVAFDMATGAIVTSFAAAANASLYAVTANAATVFFAGNLTSANGVARPGHAAAALATTGGTTGWAPNLQGGRAYGMEVSPDGSKVVFGGSFTTFNGSGNPGFGLGAVNTTTGASLPWATNSVVRNAGTKAAIYGLSSDADSVYASAYNFGGTGNTEGTARSSWDGTLIWLADCRGDNYSASSSGGVVYITGHSHQCQWVGGALALVLGHGVVSVYAAFVSVADTMVSYASGLMLPIAECRRRVL